MHKGKCICGTMYKEGQYYFQNRDIGKFISLQNAIQVLSTFLMVV